MNPIIAFLQARLRTAIDCAEAARVRMEDLTQSVKAQREWSRIHFACVTERWRVEDALYLAGLAERQP